MPLESREPRIALFMMHQQYVRPWKSETANQMDGLCSVTLQLLLLCGALASPIDSSSLGCLSNSKTTRMFNGSQRLSTVSYPASPGLLMSCALLALVSSSSWFWFWGPALL